MVRGIPGKVYCDGTWFDAEANQRYCNQPLGHDGPHGTVAERVREIVDQKQAEEKFWSASLVMGLLLLALVFIAGLVIGVVFS